MLGCAVLSAVSCVGVPPPPCVGIPFLPCAGTGGRLARPGVVRAVSGLAAAARLGRRAPPEWFALCLCVAVSIGGLAVLTGWGGVRR